MVILPTGSLAVEHAMNEKKYFLMTKMCTPPTRTVLDGAYRGRRAAIMPWATEDGPGSGSTLRSEYSMCHCHAPPRRIACDHQQCVVPRAETTHTPQSPGPKKKTVDMYPRFTRHRPFHLRPFVFFPPSHIRSDWAVRWPALNPSGSIGQSISQLVSGRSQRRPALDRIFQTTHCPCTCQTF